MKKFAAVLLSLIFVFVVSGFVSAKSESEPTFKKGDTVYVCSCGAGCDCGTVSHKAGKCSCGKDLVKTTITKIENKKLYYMVGGKELSAPAVGKYVCACGPGCDCGTISQKPGKCSCGRELKKAD